VITYITSDEKKFKNIQEAEGHEKTYLALKENQEKANKKIVELVQKSLDILHEAEEIAKEYKLAFNFNPAYGMGGTF
jgi:TorA maturation chaperone TorD